MRKLLLTVAATVLLFSAYCQFGNTNTTSTTFRNFDMYSLHPIVNGPIINAFNNSESTKGRKYFFDNWAEGTVINAQGQLIEVDSFRYNFDKVTNDLLVTVNKRQMVEVDAKNLRSFILTYEGQPFSFVKADDINPDKFLQVLVKKDNGYTLYKQINTRYKKADNSMNGLFAQGTPYDEYVDAPQYFVRLPDSKGVKSLLLKSKSIKEVLSGNRDKVNEWFSNHSDVETDEAFVIDLIESLNQ